MKRFISILLVFYFFSGTAIAGKEEVSVDNSNVAIEYRKAAEKGNAEAQFYLGMMYYKGQGIQQNYTEAVNWFRKVAVQGNASAQHNLGVMYSKGQGVQQNYSEAVNWYRKAAVQGDASAQNNLGVIYQNGYGVQKNYKEAFYWTQKAALQGHSDAKNNLGNMYFSGRGVQKNYTESANWYRKSAVDGHSDAQNNLGFMYEKGRGIQKNYTEAANWYLKSAVQGHRIAQNNLGLMYEKGQGVQKNYKEAVFWYLKAASQGNDKARLNLRNLYAREQKIFSAPVGVDKGEVSAKGSTPKTEQDSYAMAKKFMESKEYADAVSQIGANTIELAKTFGLKNNAELNQLKASLEEQEKAEREYSEAVKNTQLARESLNFVKELQSAVSRDEGQALVNAAIASGMSVEEFDRILRSAMYEEQNKAAESQKIIKKLIQSLK